MGAASGSRLIAEALFDAGVRRLHGVHGTMNGVMEEFCALGGRMVHYRHEQSAGFATDAEARLGRAPAVAVASLSPGFANYVSSMYQAAGAYSPVLLLVGGHGSSADGLGAFEEGYAAELFRGVAKATHRVLKPNTNRYWVRRMLNTAMTYPQGPVVLDFPLDNLWSIIDRSDERLVPKADRPIEIPSVRPAESAMETIAGRLSESRRPVLLAGDGAYWSGAESAISALSTQHHIPVVGRRMGRGIVPETERHGVHNGIRGRVVRDADFVLLVGMRANELEDWFEYPTWPSGVDYAQIVDSPDDAQWHLPSIATCTGSSKLAIEDLLRAMESEDGAKASEEVIADRSRWIGTLEELEAGWKETRRILVDKRADEPDIDTMVLCESIARMLQSDGVVILDSYSGSLQMTDALSARFPGQLLDGGLGGALGQGVGMAIGSALAFPDRQVVALVGDGGFGISAMDVETMLRYQLDNIRIVLINNSSWGGRALSQRTFYPAMDSWDMTPKVPYHRMFEAIGGTGFLVERRQDLAATLDQGFSIPGPVLFNVIADTHPEDMETSAQWLRHQVGEFYSRGITAPPEEAASLFRGLSARSMVRAQRFCRKQGLNVPVEFLSALSGHTHEDLIAAGAAYEGPRPVPDQVVSKSPTED